MKMNRSFFIRNIFGKVKPGSSGLNWIIRSTVNITCHVLIYQMYLFSNYDSLFLLDKSDDRKFPVQKLPVGKILVQKLRKTMIRFGEHDAYNAAYDYWNLEVYELDFAQLRS